MTQAQAIARARKLMGPLWERDTFTAKRSVKQGWIISINGRTWMSLEEMEKSGPMGEDKIDEVDD